MMDTTVNTTSSNWFFSAFEAFRARSEQRKVYRNTVRELSALTDRDLADLGLSRSMIKSIAHEAAFGA